MCLISDNWSAWAQFLLKKQTRFDFISAAFSITDTHPLRAAGLYSVLFRSFDLEVVHSEAGLQLKRDDEELLSPRNNGELFKVAYLDLCSEMGAKKHFFRIKASSEYEDHLYFGIAVPSSDLSLEALCRQTSRPSTAAFECQGIFIRYAIYCSTKPMLPQL